MSRQIVNTGGQGLASSDAVKAAFGMIIVAAAVLLIFYFLSSAAKNKAETTSLAPVTISVTV